MLLQQCKLYEWIQNFDNLEWYLNLLFKLTTTKNDESYGSFDDNETNEPLRHINLKNKFALKL